MAENNSSNKVTYALMAVGSLVGGALPMVSREKLKDFKRKKKTRKKI
ncbi:hypothetical protein [Sinobaca sp. H24]|nr:hypothetical protein [Sinobaca sp. H24]